MELAAVNSRRILPHTGQYENLPLTLAGELLGRYCQMTGKIYW